MCRVLVISFFWSATQSLLGKLFVYVSIETVPQYKSELGRQDNNRRNTEMIILKGGLNVTQTEAIIWNLLIFIWIHFKTGQYLKLFHMGRLIQQGMYCASVILCNAWITESAVATLKCCFL